MTTGRWQLALPVVLLLAGCRAQQVRPFDLPEGSDADVVKRGALNGGPTGRDGPGDSVASGHYQYPCLGLGGVALLLAPDGTTSDLVETSAPTPGLFLDDLWDGASRVSCFSISSRVVGSREPKEQRALRFRQRLSIREGVAYTAYEEKVEGRTVTSRVTTFVTPDGVLVLRFEDDTGKTPHRWRWQVSMLPEGYVVRRREVDNGALLHLQKGQAVAWGALVVEPAQDLAKTESLERVDLLLPLRGRRQPTVAYAAFSAAPDGEAQVRRHVQDGVARGYDACLKATRQWWSDFWDASSVSLPDDDLQRWYERSMFQIGCAFGGTKIPVGPMGLVPARWGGHIFAHDLTYMHYALVTGNRAGLALPLIRWYAEVLPTAQQHARDTYDVPGARYGWEQDARGREVAASPFREEHHVNGEVAFQAYLQALWTGDEEAVRLARKILPPATRFLCAHMEEANVGTGFTPVRGVYVSPQSTDLDEHAQLIRGGVSTQTAAIWCLRACRELDCLPDELRSYLDRIYLPTASWRGQQVLAVHDGDDPERPLKHPAPLAGVWWWPITDPDSGLAHRTYDNVRSRLDLTKTPTFNFPWLACIAARMGKADEALYLLRELLSTPGAAVDDTCFAESPATRWTPFLTTSGALVSAVHELLLQSGLALSEVEAKEDQLDVLPALPTAWRDQEVSFEDLLARGAITVSATYSPTELTITLLSPTATTRTLTMPLPADIAKPQLLVQGRPHTYHLDENDRLVTKLSLRANQPTLLSVEES